MYGVDHLIDEYIAENFRRYWNMAATSTNWINLKLLRLKFDITHSAE